MAKRSLASIWGRVLQRNAAAIGRQAVRAGHRAVGQVVNQAVKQAVGRTVKQTTRRPTPGPGLWSPGLALGSFTSGRIEVMPESSVSDVEPIRLVGPVKVGGAAMG